MKSIPENLHGLTRAEIVLERLRERLYRNVRLDEDTGCLIWTRRTNNQGYPIMNVRLDGYDYPVPVYAHRVSLTVFERPPVGLEEAAHDPCLCPHKACIFPGHLRWATRIENEADKRHPCRLRVREVFPPLARERVWAA